MVHHYYIITLFTLVKRPIGIRHRIEPNDLICTANQLTGFYVIEHKP